MAELELGKAKAATNLNHNDSSLKVFPGKIKSNTHRKKNYNLLRFLQYHIHMYHFGHLHVELFNR